jgi:hypothetical protein
MMQEFHSRWGTVLVCAAQVNKKLLICSDTSAIQSDKITVRKTTLIENINSQEK